MRHFQRGVSACVLVALAVLLRPAMAGAQEQVAMVDRGPRFMQPAPGGGAPQEVDVTQVSMLHRRVSLNREGATVAKLLGEITRQTGLRFSYDAEVVAVDRPVGLRADSITVAAALTEILVDAGVDVLLKSPRQAVLLRRREPLQNGAIAGQVSDAKSSATLAGATVVVEGTSQNATTDNNGRYRIEDIPAGTYTLRARYIGYAPGTASVTVGADQEATADFALEKSVQRLEQVVVTGTIVPTEQKAIPNAVSVVTGDQIEQQNFTRVDQIFRGLVPGVVAFDPGVLSDYTTALASRGANTLLCDGCYGSIKTYVDGVEVADPLFINRIDPSSIERVEVTRGPGASTVYGSSASGGVLQVFTKKGSVSGRPQVSGRALVGVIQGPVTVGTPVRQDYSLNLTGGRPAFSYNLGGSFSHTGQSAPAYWSRAPSLFGGASLSQGSVTVDLSARYADQTFSYPFDPRFPQYGLTVPLYQNNGVREATAGIQATYHATQRWQHRLILGYDAHKFSFYSTRPRLTTPDDTLQSALSADVGKASIRYNTSYDLPIGSALSMVVTAGAEYLYYTSDTYAAYSTSQTVGSLDGPIYAFRTPYSNTGYFGQAQLGISDRLFLTGGLRAERNDNFGDAYGTAWQPRVGASYLQPLGAVSVKLRGAFGNAISGVSPTLKLPIRTSYLNQVANLNLAPERQSGWEAGLDLEVGSRVSLGVTYYDQDAKDLIQGVTLDGAAFPPTVQNQNVGLVKNRGWELEGRLDLGPMNLSATFSPVTSTVRRLSPTYTGDLQVGDQLTGVQRSSAGATLQVSPFKGTSAVMGMTYLGHWTATDWIALYGFYYGGQPYRGSGRAYWIEYPSVTKLNLSLSQQLTPQLTGLVQVDNLGNNTRYEETNLSLPVGRITSIGLRFRY